MSKETIIKLVLLRMAGLVKREDILKQVSENELAELEIKLYSKYRQIKNQIKNY